MKLSLNNQILTIQILHPTSVDDVLTTLCQNKKRKYLLYQQHTIRVNHTVIKQSHPLSKNDIVTIHLPMNEDDQLLPSYHEIDIIYEDDIFCIVSKPSGILVHPDGNNQTDTMANRVKAYYLMQGIQAPVRAIHRLDIDTSGLLIFCKIPFFQPMLDQLLADKKIYRIYTAFIQGNMSQVKHTIIQPIGKDRHHSNKMRISQTGKYAKTEIQLIKNFHDYAQIQCKLYTGRTHQIRVHLAHINHPILSDTLYGGKHHCMQRLALHAHYLEIYHPIHQTYLHLEAPLPNDMSILTQNKYRKKH